MAKRSLTKARAILRKILEVANHPPGCTCGDSDCRDFEAVRQERESEQAPGAILELRFD